MLSRFAGEHSDLLPQPPEQFFPIRVIQVSKPDGGKKVLAFLEGFPGDLVFRLFAQLFPGIQIIIHGQQDHRLGQILPAALQVFYFALRLVPTLDFIQYLLSQGAELEVLAPASLRDDLSRRATAIARLYR